MGASVGIDIGIARCCGSGREFPKCCGSGKEFPAALKQIGSQDYLQGLVKKTHARGFVLEMDPKDPNLTYKLYFPDVGTSDWFRESDVHLSGAPFSVAVLPNSSKKVANEPDYSEIRDLKAGDKLAVLYLRLAQQIGHHHRKLLLSCGDHTFNESDRERCLAILGIGEGTAVHCEARAYDPSLLRVDSAAESDYITRNVYAGGEMEVVKVVSLIYGRKGDGPKRLLWAAHSASFGAAKRDGPDLAQGLAASIFGEFLHVSTPDGGKTQIPISSLFATKAPAAGTSLEEQFRAMLGGEELWAHVLSRICRKIQ